jgi:hypothetical protein
MVEKMVLAHLLFLPTVVLPTPSGMQWPGKGLITNEDYHTVINTNILGTARQPQQDIGN